MFCLKLLMKVQDALLPLHSLPPFFPFQLNFFHLLHSIMNQLSSFSTSDRKAGERFNCGLKRPPGSSDKDYIRWRNCMERDFTINGMMFDPYAKIVYDYLGGMRGIKKTKVRTIKAANLSFMEDSARILRAIRFSARLGFHLAREVFDSLEQLSTSLQKLDKDSLGGKLFVSIWFCRSFIEVIMEIWTSGDTSTNTDLASYFASHGFRRRDERSNMLMVFISMDLRLRVQRIFSCVRRHEDIGMIPKAGTTIDYESLSEGKLQEVRRVFARIVFDTVYPLKKQSSEKNVVEANNS